MPCDGHEVDEGVLLLQQLAVLIPGPTELTTAPDVRDREHHAAVQQREPCNGEARVFARLVGAVAVQQRGRRIGHPGAMDDRDRHPRAVRGDGPITALDILIRVIVAEHRLFTQQRALTGGEVDVIDAHRSDERRRADPQLG
jgi:hypothetical protein